jgi:prophage regulatory protein
MKFFLPRRTDTGSVWRDMHTTRKTGLRQSFGDDGACTFHNCRTTITNSFPVSGGSGSVSATESACTEATGTDAAPEAGDGDDDGGDGDGDPDPDGRHTPTPPPLRASRATRQKTGVNLPPENADCELWRLPTVLKRIPVSRTGWLAGVKSGLYPKPLKIGLRAVAWRASDIRALVASL